jgi:hypothetical protein
MHIFERLLSVRGQEQRGRWTRAGHVLAFMLVLVQPSIGLHDVKVRYLAAAAPSPASTPCSKDQLLKPNHYKWRRRQHVMISAHYHMTSAAALLAQSAHQVTTAFVDCSAAQ